MRQYALLHAQHKWEIKTIDLLDVFTSLEIVQGHRVETVSARYNNSQQLLSSEMEN